MLATRATSEELMDADDLDPATYAAVVHDLAKVNTLTMARRPTIDFLRSLKASELRILDVGYGDGDMLRAIRRWANDNGVNATLVGIDLNPRSAAAAGEATTGTLDIDYRTGDYVDLADEPWDVIISSLVAHHMTPAQLIAFIQFMDDHAKVGWFINDLHRHSFAYYGYPLLATIMRWHPIVRHDGRLSIARSYRPAEWPVILKEAGVTGASVTRKFPFRLCVSKTR